jgi:hypothetical protein
MISFANKAPPLHFTPKVVFVEHKSPNTKVAEGIIQNNLLKGQAMEQNGFGLTLGWHLARYDLTNGSPHVDAAIIDEMRNTMYMLLNSNNIGNLYDNDQRVLIQNILNHFAARNEMPTRNAILIGICAFRASLIGASTRPEDNLEMTDLAFSALMDVDAATIGDREHFFDQLRQANPGNIVELTDFLASLALIARRAALH